MTSMTINGTPYCAVLENEPLSIDSEYTRFVREFLASTGTLPESQLRTLQLRVRGSFCSLLGMENTVCDFIDLQGVDFSGLELKGLDLSYSYLARAKFC